MTKFLACISYLFLVLIFSCKPHESEKNSTDLDTLTANVIKDSNLIFTQKKNRDYYENNLIHSNIYLNNDTTIFTFGGSLCLMKIISDSGYYSIGTYYCVDSVESSSNYQGLVKDSNSRLISNSATISYHVYKKYIPYGYIFFYDTLDILIDKQIPNGKLH